MPLRQLTLVVMCTDNFGVISKMKDVDILKAHEHSSNHFDEIHASDKCGCFYCLSIYRPSDIKEWIDDGECAICPKCGIDSVIGSSSGYPITEEFLKRMCENWFSTAE